MKPVEQVEDESQVEESQVDESQVEESQVEDDQQLHSIPNRSISLLQPLNTTLDPLHQTHHPQTLEKTPLAHQTHPDPNPNPEPSPLHLDSLDLQACSHLLLQDLHQSPSDLNLLLHSNSDPDPTHSHINHINSSDSIHPSHPSSEPNSPFDSQPPSPTTTNQDCHPSHSSHHLHHSSSIDSVLSPVSATSHHVFDSRSPSPPQTVSSKIHHLDPSHQTLDPRTLPNRHKFSSLLSFSLWDHLKYEIDAENDDEDSLNATSLRSERVSNFLNVPISIEQMISFGFVICLDAFLSVFTILPIKFFCSLAKLISSLARRFQTWLARSRSSPNTAPYKSCRLNVSCKIDLIQGLLIILVCLVLHQITDASRMYHSVRGQETIKLYVIFNVLEIADRLCCSFGQDILDSLFCSSTLGRRVDGSQPRLKPLFLFVLAFIFTVAHTLVLFYQLVSLNVAINSYDHSLMTLLISNQFVEIKGSVFKKFEKENLFQMSCADIVERFQLFLMLNIIAFRNLIELSGSSSTLSTHAYSYTYQYLPRALDLFPSLSLLQTIFLPALIVMLSEVVVDWLKHAFITKFNHIRPAVYGRFIDVLCKDLVGEEGAGAGSGARGKPFVDRAPAVSRRLGFSVFPICCLMVRVFFQALDMLSDATQDDERASPLRVLTDKLRGADGALDALSLARPPSAFSAVQLDGLLVLGGATAMLFLVLFKLCLGIWLRLYAGERVRGLEARAGEDVLNGRDRRAIGCTDEEVWKEKVERKAIEADEFDVPRPSRQRPAKSQNAQTQPPGSSTESPGAGRQPKVKISMDELGRFDMVRSRIW